MEGCNAGDAGAHPNPLILSRGALEIRYPVVMLAALEKMFSVFAEVRKASPYMLFQNASAV